MRQLFEIEDVFDLNGRGCILVPGIPHSFPDSISVGAAIVIEPPSGRAFETSIAAFEMINRGRPVEHVAFSVPRSHDRTKTLASKLIL
jgi:hypothetical protein